jgi:hypothetical protein
MGAVLGKQLKAALDELVVAQVGVALRVDLEGAQQPTVS